MILDEARMHKHTYEAYKDKIKVENIITTLFKVYKIRKQKTFQKIEHICESVSLDDQEHSPHPRGEDLPGQLYACDRLQYEIQYLEAWTSTDSHHWLHRKREEEICTQKLQSKA
jgi:hypothetical protein